MTEDKIKLLLKEINDLRQNLKGIKSDIKQEEKIGNEQYLELKKAYKDLRVQIKGIEEDELADLKSDESYNELRKLQLEKEEELAHAREKLFENIGKLPKKAFEMDIDTEEGRVKLQALPDMRVFLNGKEEKKNI